MHIKPITQTPAKADALSILAILAQALGVVQVVANLVNAFKGM